MVYILLLKQSLKKMCKKCKIFLNSIYSRCIITCNNVFECVMSICSVDVHLNQLINPLILLAQDCGECFTTKSMVITTEPTTSLDVHFTTIKESTTTKAIFGTSASQEIEKPEFTTSNFFSFISLNDWIECYAVSAIYRSCNDGGYISYEIHRNPVKRSFACQGGLLSLTRGTI